MIRAAALLALAASGLGIPAVTPAGADGPTPSPVADGGRCRLTAVVIGTAGEEDGRLTAVIDGGPLVAASPGASISITCTIQVGAANATHAGADVCSAANGPALQQVVLPPTACSYVKPEGQPAYLCTETAIDGTRYYWDATTVNPGPPEVAEGWTMNNAALCPELLVVLTTCVVTDHRPYWYSKRCEQPTTG